MSVSCILCFCVRDHCHVVNEIDKLLKLVIVIVQHKLKAEHYVVYLYI